MSRVLPWALQACRVSVQLGGRPVLKSIDLDVRTGQWTCVVGPNGAGKSTLLKALAGLLPMHGEVFWQGQPLSALTRRERAQRLSWLGQSEMVLLDLRVHDVVMLGRLPYQDWLASPSAHDQANVESALRAMQAWDWCERTLGELSGGERQRVLLARALAGQTPLMVMDEPLTNLDPPHQVDWLEQVHALRSQGTTVLSVLHEINVALHADQIVVMAQGRVLHHGSAQDAQTHRAIEAVFNERIRIVAVDGQWVMLPRTLA